MIKNAFEVPRLVAISVIINSSGGCPVNSSLIAEYIISLSELHDIPVFAFVERVAASGGYILALAANKIFANEYSIVGSIGAIITTVSFEDFLHKFGIKPIILTAGGKKGMMNPLETPNRKEVEEVQILLDEAHKNFINFVKLRRGDLLKADESEEIFSGNVFMGKKALVFGLVDDIYTVMEETLSK